MLKYVLGSLLLAFCLIQITSATATTTPGTSSSSSYEDQLKAALADCYKKFNQSVCDYHAKNLNTFCNKSAECQVKFLKLAGNYNQVDYYAKVLEMYNNCVKQQGESVCNPVADTIYTVCAQNLKCFYDGIQLAKPFNGSQ